MMNQEDCPRCNGNKEVVMEGVIIKCPACNEEKIEKPSHDIGDVAEVVEKRIRRMVASALLQIANEIYKDEMDN